MGEGERGREAGRERGEPRENIVFQHAHLSILDVCKSAGPDGLSGRFLKKITAEIAAPLAHLYNLSLQQGIVPCAWKQSHITPVHNGGPTDDPSNYRPIAVVSVVAKVFEKLLLLSYLLI